MATKHENPLARLHALWTLEGLRIRDPNVILPALEDADPKIRAAAIRLAEPLFTTPLQARATAAVLKRAADAQPDVRLQLALTVSVIGTTEADAAIASILTSDSRNARVRESVITGVRGRELDLLIRLLDQAQWSTTKSGRAAMLTALGRCIVNEANPRRVAQLLEIIAAQPSDRTWRQVALLDAFGPTAGVKKPRPLKPITLDAEPTKFLALLTKSAGPDDALQSKLQDARARIHWPGEPGYKPPPPPPPLTAEQQAQFERGRIVYGATCAACHKPTGNGQVGLAPPLLDSEWALGPPRRLARIILHGVQGPITVDGEAFNLDMPGVGKLSDDEIADVMTYVRRAWGHGASPVNAGDIRKVRATTRPVPWTERELLKAR
jgi:mono/diheme cytochrome c family protein